RQGPDIVDRPAERVRGVVIQRAVADGQSPDVVDSAANGLKRGVVIQRAVADGQSPDVVDGTAAGVAGDAWERDVAREGAVADGQGAGVGDGAAVDSGPTGDGQAGDLDGGGVPHREDPEVGGAGPIALHRQRAGPGAEDGHAAVQCRQGAFQVDRATDSEG